MRVLVTRPRPEAERTAARIAALGFEPVVLPVSEAVFPHDALAAAVRQPWTAVAVTSANGVRAILRRPEAIEGWRHLPFFAVGKRTAEVAREAGFEDVRIGGGTGESLAEAVTNAVAGGLAVTETAPLLYCAGQPRGGAFEHGLAAKGVLCNAVECYRMDDIAYPADVLRRALVDLPLYAALFYSQASVLRFLRLLAAAGLAETFRVRRILCLSDSVAAVLPESLRSIAATADSPSEDRLLEMLAAIQT